MACQGLPPSAERCQVQDVSPSTPSGSSRTARSWPPTCGGSVSDSRDTAPASSTLTTLTVTLMVASTVASTSPAAFLPSLTVTVSE